MLSTGQKWKKVSDKNARTWYRQLRKETEQRGIFVHKDDKEHDIKNKLLNDHQWVVLSSPENGDYYFTDGTSGYRSQANFNVVLTDLQAQDGVNVSTVDIGHTWICVRAEDSKGNPTRALKAAFVWKEYGEYVADDEYMTVFLTAKAKELWGIHAPTLLFESLKYSKHCAKESASQEQCMLWTIELLPHKEELFAILNSEYENNGGVDVWFTEEYEDITIDYPGGNLVGEFLQKILKEKQEAGK